MGATTLSKIYTKLELDKILARLEERCASPLGAELARALTPSRDLEVVRRRLQATTEAEQVRRRYPDIPLYPIHDIRPQVARAAVGGILEGEDLLRVAATLATARRLRQFLLGLEGDWPQLRQLAGGIGDYRSLEKAITAAIGPDGEVLDQATPRLYSLRQQIRRTGERVKERLDGYLHSTEMQKYLQDNLYTIRNDRYVLPVKQEYRHQVPGLIHDQSASGATLFIEPMALVELNNELRRLQAAANREVEAILQQLSAAAGRDREGLAATLAALGEIDFTMAKGSLSRDMAATEPMINSDGRWRIRHGRHPLLKGEAVPVSLPLGEEFTTLVITGPNTGGKTVTLKTIGLFTLMAGCGLHLPAASGTEVDPAAAVYADIGDEQSIEQSLSTFSAHMAQIVAILREVTPGSLVLLDELGAGTDPAEGAALAMAILDYLTGMGARTVATTHYSELKAYAYATPQVENAAVEFDTRTLQPTFNLIIGTPGESNAFIIASRLGLAPAVIDRARSLLGEENQRVSRLISALTEDRRASAQERQQAEILRRQAEMARAEVEKAKQAWQQEAARQMEKARQEARGLLRRARAEIREIMAGIEKAMATENRRGQQQAVTAARQRLKELEATVEAGLEQYRPVAGEGAPENLKAGEKVYLLAWDQTGEVLEPANDQGDVLVQLGALKVSVPLKELRRVAKSPRPRHQEGAVAEGPQPGAAARSGWTIKTAASDTVSPEIDLRGLTVDEACHQVDVYLDDVALAGLNRVHLIHGKGTGALRTALQDYLRQHPLVKGLRPGGAGEGGSGVTVVEIRL